MSKPTRAKPKRKPVCSHEKDIPRESIMYRCRCGNVWMGGKFFGSVPQDQGAVSIFGAFSRLPANVEEP